MCSMAGTCIALSYVALKQYCLRLLYSGIKSESLDFTECCLVSAEIE